jgi:hypothetical protein
MALRWLREPFEIGAIPRAHSRRARYPFAPPFAPLVAALSRAVPRRSARRFSRPPGLARAPTASAPRAQFQPSDARGLPAQQASLDAGAALPSGAFRIRARANLGAIPRAISRAMVLAIS